MSCLHRQRVANTKRCECHHRGSAHTDGYHLPEDRPDLEKLTRERRNENPVEQTEIELEIIFHPNSRARIMPRLAECTKRKVLQPPPNGVQKTARPTAERL